jgi:NADH-quinone oxidoreductase subunit G
METVTLSIDGRQVTVEKGRTVLQAAIEAGISVPYYCYHPGIGVDGSCRVCVVKIEKMPKLQTSCSMVCTEGMVVSTRDPDVVRRAPASSSSSSSTTPRLPRLRQRRRMPAPGFLVHVRAGRKPHGLPAPRVRRRRRQGGRRLRTDADAEPEPLHPVHALRPLHERRRRDAQIGIVDRGYGSEISTFNEEGVHSLLSGNLMDVCPVGAITTRDYRFKSRPWDNPNVVDTMCTLCSKGCSTSAWLKAKPEWAKVHVSSG